MTKIIIVLAAIGLFSLSSCDFFGGNNELIPSDEDIAKEYLKSKDDFNNKYRGKEVVFWGIVDSINNLGDYANVRFKDSPGVDTSMPNITCVVEKADMSKFDLMKVESGTWVRVKGKMEVKDSSTYDPLEVKPCQLVTTGPTNVMSDK